MKKQLRILLVLFVCALFVAPVAADDEGDGNGLTADMQWGISDTAWQRRQYSDAASMFISFAEANPDHPNALEAWYRAYTTYRAYRPNPEKRKQTYDKGLAAADRWAKKYPDSDRERAANGLWYEATISNDEGQRAQAISYMQDLVKRYPGTGHEGWAYWSLGEWFREAGRYKEAAAAFEVAKHLPSLGEYMVISAYREGWCYDALKDHAGLVATYKEVLTGPYNWNWWSTPGGALDAAQRLKAIQEDELARALALKIIDKSPPSWTDYQNQARAILGEANKKSLYVYLYQYINYAYTTDKINIDVGTQVNLVKDMPLLVRLSYVSKEAPFKGTLSMTPKAEMAKKADNLKADGANMGADIVAPDTNGGITGDWWYRFTGAQQTTNVPDNVVVTRKFTPQGKGWGECTIRVQTNPQDRWWIHITLPNDKTNVNNLSAQPNDVIDGGKTFRWYPYYDWSAGLTVKFPVAIGEGIEQYYPKVWLERSYGGRYPDKSALGTTAEYDVKEMSAKLSSATQFPYTISFPSTTDITLEEVVK